MRAILDYLSRSPDIQGDAPPGVMDTSWCSSVVTQPSWCSHSSLWSLVSRSVISLVIIPESQHFTFQAAFDSHNFADPPKLNMYTLHSWVGLTAALLFEGQVRDWWVIKYFWVKYWQFFSMSVGPGLCCLSLPKVLWRSSRFRAAPSSGFVCYIFNNTWLVKCIFKANMKWEQQSITKNNQNI